jgi:hypothetical protein
MRQGVERLKYLVAGILVEAVISPGGGFYEVTVELTGEKQRYIADVFEMVAIPRGACSTHRTPHPQNSDCKEWRHV